MRSHLLALPVQALRLSLAHLGGRLPSPELKPVQRLAASSWMEPGLLGQLSRHWPCAGELAGLTAVPFGLTAVPLGLIIAVPVGLVADLAV